MLLAPVLPFRFTLLNLRVRDGNNALCQPLETLEWRFAFWRFRRFHKPCYRILAFVQSLPSHRYPDEAESYSTPDNCFFGASIVPNLARHFQNIASCSRDTNAISPTITSRLMQIAT
jgi:hypothetical protein